MLTFISTIFNCYIWLFSALTTANKIVPSERINMTIKKELISIPCFL